MSLDPQVRKLLKLVLSCSLVQVGIFSRLLLIGNPGGELMECLLPPCQRAYPLWMAASLFAANAVLALRLLVALGRAASRPAGDGLLYMSMGVAIVNVALDTHYAHLIPHAGESLNMLMYSNVPVAEQALSPFVSVFLSMAVMGLNVLSHRALTDLSVEKRLVKSD
eukprot:CAMPEP_0194292100 /NCGR_PEP_ID=MMETSP0169-20130528/44888_1 /TAXON_ID=218684 /ORGANISM="Corethron pennatum, Strain L29A3" /LENGTH=165 /DNA_ID=CAMNT_0039040169 /DNA_START=83 /DNA_END=580 /DNA_ORIENTATION=+